jgi:hypothetical protein
VEKKVIDAKTLVSLAAPGAERPPATK